VVQQGDRLERRAEHEHLAVGGDEARERAVGAVALVLRVAGGQLVGPRADGHDARLRVRAAPRPRPRAHALGDAAVVARRLAGRGVEDRRLGQVGVDVLLRPVARVVDVLLPGGVGEERPVRPEGVEEREDDGLAAAHDPAERAHARVDHERAAGAHAEAPEVGGEPRARHRAGMSAGLGHPPEPARRGPGASPRWVA
jgi:hypothetical protein